MQPARYKILFTNIGYAKGIDGSLKQHISRFGRHFYCKLPVQEQVLAQLKSIIALEKPDLCCIVEIDQGSIHSGYYNQLHALVDDDYKHHDIAGKYGETSILNRMMLHKGKSNAFLAARDYPFERLYFTHGTKRLIYHVSLPDDLHVFFAHFSLQKDVRARQFHEMHEIVKRISGKVVILADFNIMQGFAELRPLLRDTDLELISREDEHTFTFHRRKLALDLCLCSASLAPNANVRVIGQNFSDHAALMVEIAV